MSDKPQDLTNVLSCPKCHGPVLFASNSDGANSGGGSNASYQCNACRLKFWVHHGIPNFLIEEAEAYTESHDG